MKVLCTVALTAVVGLSLLGVCFAQENTLEYGLSATDFVGATKRENNFYFDFGSGVASMSFDDLWFDITPGQPYDLPVAKTEGNSLHVSFFAGRKGNIYVANNFKKILDYNPSYMLGLRGGWVWSDLMPEALNFRIFGWLSINGEPIGLSVFQLGQGHSGSANNWWLGQRLSQSDSAWQVGATASIEVYSKKNTYCLLDTGKSSYRVQVVKGKCHDDSPFITSGFSSVWH